VKNHKGFTITEALISVALISVAIVMFGYLINSFSLVRKGQVSSTAISYARTVADATIVLWRRNEFYTKDVLPKNLPTPPTGYAVYLTAGSHPVYTLTPACAPNCWAPASLASPDLSTAKTLTVTIKDISNTTLATLSTVVAKPLP
jgi:type II secretory pathway pseudopilin PulG